MVRGLIAWALDNPFIVVLLALALFGLGLFSFRNINIEAYPDPAPPTVEVVTLWSGASAEEVEQRVTTPVETTLQGIPGLQTMNSKTVFGLSDIKILFTYGTDYLAARQETLNRLQMLPSLPPGVTPQLSPESPTGEIYRYYLKAPKDAEGRNIYSYNDLKALQDWVLEREFRGVKGVVDVTSWGGTVRRYEVQPDPDRMRRYGITLVQLQNTLANANASVGGDYITQGPTASTLRSVGLFGGGEDPVYKAMREKDPVEAAKILRNEEEVRLRNIRSLVIATVNNVPVLVEDVVEGGRLGPDERVGEKGVIVSHQTRLGMMGHYMVKEGKGKNVNEYQDRFNADHSLTLRDVGFDDPDQIGCIVLLRKGEATLPTLKLIEAKVKELNDPKTGPMLPGVSIVPYYDRTELTNMTTDTVVENLLVGMSLVMFILLLFLGNIRTAVIVAVNIPLALLFAFSVLYLRGKSANLLSIGAVDFGIIVDSSVIITENIYRHLSSGENSDLPLKTRIIRAASELDHALLFSTLIMVCAFIPLFTLEGPAGALFGPMAQTYASALGGALVLALMLAPVLCSLFFKEVKPVSENFFVRAIKNSYLVPLAICLKHRYVTTAFFLILFIGTLCMLPGLGREFMPELEEGNLWIRDTAPLNISFDKQLAISTRAREIIASFPEVTDVINQMGRTDDGTDTDGYYNSEFFVPLRPQKDWPAVKEYTGWRRYVFGAMRPRTKTELTAEMRDVLQRELPGIDWNFSQNIRDNVMEALSGVKGDNSLKIVGPDLKMLQGLGEKAQDAMLSVQGLEDVGLFSVQGQSHLEFRPDPKKCQRWGVQVADVNNLMACALGGQAVTQMIEGEKRFDVSIRWPVRLRDNETSVLDIPIDVANNQVVEPQGPGFAPSATGTGRQSPARAGTLATTGNPLSNTPRLRLRDVVSPEGDDGSVDKKGKYVKPGAAVIYREQMKRLIAVKFSVRGRDLAGAVDAARQATEPLFQTPYHPVWSGEFEEMQDAEARLSWIVPLSLCLIFLLLYMALHSWLDSMVVICNVFAMSMGGVWALFLTNTNFSISAAVGFISLFGVSIMDGLLLVSYFNALRSKGHSLSEAIIEGASKRVRPVMMTDLTAMCGLLPAAFSTKIGSQTQRPLAIVVVGGMITMLLLTRYLTPVLYSFYGDREPPKGSSGIAH
jgi:cobalt-zinc-cadmium resistance protein CzcA